MTAAQIVRDEDSVVICDSDIIFIRHFDEDRLMLNQPILIRRNPVEESGKQRLYMKIAREILRIPEGSTDHNFMSWPAIFRKDWLRNLQQYLEAIYGMSWQSVLHGFPAFSEYCLYGVYVEEVLRPKYLRILDTPLHVGVWDRDSLISVIGAAKAERRDNSRYDNQPWADPVCIVVQSNLGISPDTYQRLVREKFFG